MVISSGTFRIHVSDLIFTQFFESAHKFVRKKKLMFVRTFSLTVIRRTGYIVQKVTEIKFPLGEQSIA